MPILAIQRRLVESGRIRIGQRVPTKGGKTRPAKLDTFRLTSNDRSKIEHVAELYGGEVKPWKNDSLEQWEVVTDTDVLDVIVPPTDMAFSQFMELWSGGGCARRCDTQRELISDQPCMCDPDPEQRECKPTTRLSLMLARVQGMGLWRVETHGWYAATELAGSVQLIQSAAGRGHLLPATLRLDKRTVSRPGQPRRDFAVPVLDVRLPLAEIAQATAGSLGDGHTNGSALPGASVAELEQSTSSEPIPLTPIPPSTPFRDPGSVAEQVQRHQRRAEKPKPQRKGAAAPIPSTGKKPRTVDERDDTPPPLPEPDDSGAAPSEVTLTPGQIRLLMAKAKAAKLDDDDAIHDVIRMVTSGRIASRKQMTRADLDQFIVACDLIEGDYVELRYHPGAEQGIPALIKKADGKAIQWPTNPLTVANWIEQQTSGGNNAA